MSDRRGLHALAGLLASPLAVQSPMQLADAIAVLGAPLTGDGRLTDVLEERVRAGAELYRQGLAPIVCVTGGGPPGRVEADAMAARLLELGVPATALRVDRTARNTDENAARIAALLFRSASVWIVTQPFHLRRSLRSFARVGLRPLGWRIQRSVQDAHPERALRWISREYLALLRPRWTR